MPCSLREREKKGKRKKSFYQGCEGETIATVKKVWLSKGDLFIPLSLI